MTGLGCDFLTEPCNDRTFPYLCDTSLPQLVCTYDHLTKVCSYCNVIVYIYMRMYVVIILTYIVIYCCYICQGICYHFWSGFDGCPVVFTTSSDSYCRTETIVNVRLKFILYNTCDIYTIILICSLLLANQQKLMAIILSVLMELDYYLPTLVVPTLSSQ